MVCILLWCIFCFDVANEMLECTFFEMVHTLQQRCSVNGKVHFLKTVFTLDIKSHFHFLNENANIKKSGYMSLKGVQSFLFI